MCIWFSLDPLSLGGIKTLGVIFFELKQIKVVFSQLENQSSFPILTDLTSVFRGASDNCDAMSDEECFAVTKKASTLKVPSAAAASLVSCLIHSHILSSPLFILGEEVFKGESCL